MEATQPTRHASSAGGSPHGSAAARLARLCLKELREVLRDRRTIVTLVLMPILVYPLLALVFHRFLLTSLAEVGPLEYVVAAEPGNVGRYVARLVAEGDRYLAERARQRGDDSPAESDNRRQRWLPRPGVPREQSVRWYEADDVERELRDRSIDLAIVVRQPDSGSELVPGRDPLRCELVYRKGSSISEGALEFVETRLGACNDRLLRAQLRQLEVDPLVAAKTSLRAVEVDDNPGFSIASVVPLILILMTVTGAVYPAIDLTAGERERGTLETLIAAPVPRHGLLLAKYVAVLTVAVLTAVANMLAMTVTAYATGLASSMFGDAGLNVWVILSVFGLLVLFASFFSAILLALTTHARSFKEAQAYLIPLMLLSLGPGIMGLSPGLEMGGLLSVTPLLNIVLLARDVFQGEVHLGVASAAVCSTALYALAALSLAARIFGTDAVLYGSQSSWTDVFRRPKQVQHAVPPTAGWLGLAILFPCHFLVINSLSQVSQESMRSLLLLCGAAVAVLFGGIPWLLTRFNRVSPRWGFRLRSASGWCFLAAAVLGVSAWPLAHEIFLLGERLGMESLGAERIAAVKGLLAQWQQVPLWILLLSLAVAPGVFEELFFRGFLFASLGQVWKPWKTIVVTAILFGLFHVVSASALAPERLLPSTFLGLLLGWVAHRTGSVLPCMLLHTLHNGLLLTIAYFREELAEQGLGTQLQRHLPAGWQALSIAGLALAATLLVAATRKRQRAH